MPHKRTVKRWLAEKPLFQARYACAKEEMAEHIAEEILEIADHGSNDWIERELESGNVIKVPDHEHIARSRLRVDTRKWLMSKLLPKKFGERLHVDAHIDLEAQLKSMTPAERLARAEELLSGATRYLPLLEQYEREHPPALIEGCVGKIEAEVGDPAPQQRRSTRGRHA